MTYSSRPYILLLVGTSCCAPAIYTFHVTPNRVCKGDPVTLDWQASKPGKLSATPEQPALGDVAATGRTAVVPAADPSTSSVRYHFEVSNLWGSAARDNDVELIAGKPLDIGNSVADPAHPATCTGDTLSVVAVAPASAWSAHAVVADITTLAADKHRYHVEHEGVKVDLTPGQVSQAFKGRKVAGEWLLSLTLLEGEQCRTPSVPRNLGIRLLAACSTETP